MNNKTDNDIFLILQKDMHKNQKIKKNSKK